MREVAIGESALEVAEAADVRRPAVFREQLRQGVQRDGALSVMLGPWLLLRFGAALPPHHRRANVFTPTWSPSFVRRPVSPVGDQLHENDIVDSDGVPTSAMVVGSKPALQSRWP
jgi:hypothetical protein